MTDRISTDELRHAAQPRRLYHHVLHGGSLTPDDVSIMVQIIEELEAEVIRLREALGEIQRLSGLVGNDLVGRVDASKSGAVLQCSDIARAALNHKETE